MQGEYKARFPATAQEGTQWLMLGWHREGEENKEDMNHSGNIFQFSSMVKSLELISRQPSFKEALFIAQLQPRLSKNPVSSVTICINRTKV